jgi:hypothetical protein
VILQLDDAERTVAIPPELQAILSQDKEAAKAFGALAYSWIAAALDCLAFGGGGDVAGVRRSRTLDEEKVHFLLGHRPMLNAFGHDE